MTGADLRREIASFALWCPNCRRGPVARPDVLRTRIEAGHHACDHCGHREPVEQSYLEAQQKLPFTNVPLVSNRTEVGVTTVPIGRLHTIRVSDGLKALDWVTASANAEFPATVAIVARSSDSFSVVLAPRVILPSNRFVLLGRRSERTSQTVASSTRHCLGQCRRFTALP